MKVLLCLTCMFICVACADGAGDLSAHDSAIKSMQYSLDSYNDKSEELSEVTKHHKHSLQDAIAIMTSDDWRSNPRTFPIRAVVGDEDGQRYLFLYWIQDDEDVTGFVVKNGDGKHQYPNVVNKLDPLPETSFRTLGIPIVTNDGEEVKDSIVDSIDHSFAVDEPSTLSLLVRDSNDGVKASERAVEVYYNFED